MIKKHVTNAELKSIFGVNFFIVGGGSNLLNINKYFSDFFKLDVKKLDITNKKKNEIELYENFSSCLGFKQYLGLFEREGLFLSIIEF